MYEYLPLCFILIYIPNSNYIFKTKHNETIILVMGPSPVNQELWL